MSKQDSSFYCGHWVLLSDVGIMWDYLHTTGKQGDLAVGYQPVSNYTET